MDSLLTINIMEYLKISNNFRDTMNIIKIEKSNQELKLSLFESNLTLIESNAFEDLSTTNFYMQALLKKHNIKKVLFVVHDKCKNSVEMTFAEEENSFFIT
jgi:hypothetical protein